jgi:hypothetical protein
MVGSGVGVYCDIWVNWATNVCMAAWVNCADTVWAAAVATNPGSGWLTNGRQADRAANRTSEITVIKRVGLIDIRKSPFRFFILDERLEEKFPLRCDESILEATIRLSTQERI